VWNSQSGDYLDAEYIAAYEAVQLLREDLTPAGVVKLFDMIGLGWTFEQAYHEVSGGDFSVFDQRFPERVRAVAPSYPGVATANDTPRGAGLSFVLYGFRPGATVRISISGNGYTAAQTVTMDAFGVYFSWLGASWPAGTYTITTAGPNGNAKFEVLKT
jgi:hypothetical protein